MNTTKLMEFEIVPNDLELAAPMKDSLESAFVGFFREAETIRIKAENITNPKEAREARLEIKAVRVAAEKTRKELKEDSLRVGKAIDGANNILLAKIVPIERAMEQIEKEEERRIAAIIESRKEQREALLAPLGHIATGVSLGTMADNDWDVYYQQAKDIHALRVERERKEKEEADAAAKKEAEEREAQRLENIRLKQEAEAREKAIAEERKIAAEKEAKDKAEREAIEENARKEKLRLQAIAEAERQKAQAAAEKAAAEKAKIEAEAKALREAEAKRVADEKAAAEARAKAEREAAKKAAAAPDKLKLQGFAATVSSLEVPAMKSEAGQLVANEIAAKVTNFAKWIESQAATL